MHRSAAGSIDFQRDTSAVHRRRQRSNHGSRVYGKTTPFLSNDVPPLPILLQLPQFNMSWPLSKARPTQVPAGVGFLHALVRPFRMETLVCLAEALLESLAPLATTRNCVWNGTDARLVCRGPSAAQPLAAVQRAILLFQMCYAVFYRV